MRCESVPASHAFPTSLARTLEPEIGDCRRSVHEQCGLGQSVPPEDRRLPCGVPALKSPD